ncbi:MAG: hypothetical protein J6Y60_03545 [Treponema sp.]|nr:hypothetical protein [Treponema sp.]
MAYGMTYEQFWYGDPWMVKAFEESYLLKRRVKNEEFWLQGAYIYRAVHAVVASAIGGRTEKYLTNPFDFLPKTKLEQAQEEHEKRMKIIRFFDSLIVKKKDNDE